MDCPTKYYKKGNKEYHLSLLYLVDEKDITDDIGKFIRIVVYVNNKIILTDSIPAHKNKIDYKYHTAKELYDIVVEYFEKEYESAERVFNSWKKQLKIIKG